MSDNGLVTSKRRRKADKVDKTPETENHPKGIIKKKGVVKAKPKGTSGPGRRRRSQKVAPKETEDENPEDEGAEEDYDEWII
ncbi:hypothetical protein WA026_017202 [Henosepilachna vigintioctopunctata]|uniref:Uncharacterized protein n=1 Tax=Henosepilachna vigintioctopunctata TaxID=420089 RepID=A0AAW1UKR5_9CUCU